MPYYVAVQIPTNEALPGWVAYAETYQQSQVWYNGVSAGGALVSIIDRHTSIYSNYVMGGNFTVTLDAGTYFTNFPQGIAASAAIAQAGTIPAAAKSLLFDANFDVEWLQVAFGGQTLPFFALSAGSNYTRYGANISGLAGQSGELRFTEHPDIPTQIHKIVFLDNITFSEIPIPEPQVLWLLGLGGLLLALRNRKFRSRGESQLAAYRAVLEARTTQYAPRFTSPTPRKTHPCPVVR